MHSSTITAFLLPLLFSSVLAVPTPVQNEAATQSNPPPAQVSAKVSLEKGLANSGHPLVAAWVEAGSPGRKRSIIGRQAAPTVSPETLDPNAGLTAMQIYAKQGMESQAIAQATGQDHDPHSCPGGCERSLKGRQVDEDPDDGPDDDDDDSPANANPKEGISSDEQDLEQQMTNTDNAQAKGQDPALCDGPCTRSLESRQDDPEAATTPATDAN